jgi:hypothetical protein
MDGIDPKQRGDPRPEEDHQDQYEKQGYGVRQLVADVLHKIKEPRK